MSIPLDNHHELCHGDDCGTWDCADLPENIGAHRVGYVIENNPVGEPDGSVEIEWSDGTRSILRPKVPTAVEIWEQAVAKGGRCKDPMCKCNDPTEPKIKENRA